MRFRIGCTDGNTYEGDDIPETEMQAYLDATDGNVGGTGVFKDVRAHTVDEFVDFMEMMIKGGDGFTPKTLTLYVNGQERLFQSETIVWHEVVRDA